LLWYVALEVELWKELELDAVIAEKLPNISASSWRYSGVALVEVVVAVVVLDEVVAIVQVNDVLVLPVVVLDEIVELDDNDELLVELDEIVWVVDVVLGMLVVVCVELFVVELVVDGVTVLDEVVELALDVDEEEWTITVDEEDDADEVADVELGLELPGASAK
jgi:hypothetical protein